MIRYNIRIEALFAGPVMINLVLLLMLCWKRRSLLRQLSVRFISPALIRRFTQYGFVGFLSSLGVFILVSSDRYIIALFEDISRVGIYNQVYQVGQVSVYFLITAYFNAITPGLNRLLTGKSTGAETRLEAYIQAFLLFMIPVTFYLSLFSEQVADFLLGGEFRQGYTMIPWIMVSSFFYGLSLFSETRMKFENRFKPVIQGVILACILNGVLNFALIPVLGYTWAAVTTFLAYFFLFLFYYKKDDIRYLRGETLRITGRVLMVLLLQYLADQILRKVLGIGLNKWLTLIEVIIFSVIYLAAVFRLGLSGSLRLTGLKP
jgi:O-antigen/teichoic acid export membrane protein